MRVELSAVISIIIGGFSTTVLLFFGDERAQYSASLLLIALPFVLVLCMFVLAVIRSLLTRLGLFTLTGFLFTAFALSSVIAFLVIPLGGIFPTFCISAGVFISFGLFYTLESKYGVKYT
jgi:FtsH-binding integral membrane protein